MIQDKKDYVHKDAYDMLWEKCEILEMKQSIKIKEIENANSNMVFKLEREVSRLRSNIMRLYDEQGTVGDRYVFSNIPNDLEGQTFVQAMKLYLNDTSYTMKARGQYLDKDKLSQGESWRNFTYGQPLHKSKCIRLYIEKKKGK